MTGGVSEDRQGGEARRSRAARSAAALDHPFICDVIAIAQTEHGRDFIAMEYLEGETLQARLARGAAAAAAADSDLGTTVLSAKLPEHRRNPEFGILYRIYSQGFDLFSHADRRSQGGQEVANAMMLTILGFSLTSVAVPVWLFPDDGLPRVVGMDEVR